MSTVTEITTALPSLTTAELREVQRQLHVLYRERKTSVLYDDNYGVMTDEDIIAGADEAFLEYDRAEEVKNATH